MGFNISYLKDIIERHLWSTVQFEMSHQLGPCLHTRPERRICILCRDADEVWTDIYAIGPPRHGGLSKLSAYGLGIIKPLPCVSRRKWSWKNQRIGIHLFSSPL